MPPRFSSPPEPQVFNARIWEIVRQIPAGQVSTYGQLAAMLPPPGSMTARDYAAFGARWVGGAMAACPPDVPWQRVINAQGKISLRGGGGPSQQQALLEAEGVVFDDRGRVDLAHYGWAGPAADWLAERGLLPPPALGKPTQPRLF